MASSFVPPKPDESNAISLKVLRPFVGWYLGILPGIADNESESAVQYIASHSSESFQSIVSRPGQCSDDTSNSGFQLIATQMAPVGPGSVTYVDLAAFILDAMKDTSLEGHYPFVAVTKKRR